MRFLYFLTSLVLILLSPQVLQSQDRLAATTDSILESIIENYDTLLNTNLLFLDSNETNLLLNEGIDNFSKQYEYSNNDSLIGSDSLQFSIEGVFPINDSLKQISDSIISRKEIDFTPISIQFNCTLLQLKGDVYYLVDSSGTKAYTGDCTGRYLSGKIKIESSFLDGLKNGAEKEFYESGNLKKALNYSYGDLNGVVIDYFEQGQKRTATDYKNGSKDGTETEYYLNGNKKKEAYNYQGETQGIIEQWFENGQKSSEETIAPFKGRDGKYMRWYNTGYKEYECTYDNSKLNGNEIYWHPNGKKKAINTYDMGVLKSNSLWYADGGKKSIQYFEQDKKNGKWLTWYENGNKALEENFEKGELIYELKWYKTGFKEVEIFYQKAQVIKKTKWRSNGQKHLEKEYNNNGELIKLVKYDEEGVKSIPTTYKDGKIVLIDME